MLRIKGSVHVDDRRADEARQFVRRIEESLDRTPGQLPVDGLDRISAADRTATVTCVVGADGDFVDLSIGTDWWYTLGAPGVAAAVLDALQFAQHKAMLAMALLRRHGRPAPSAPAAAAFGQQEPAHRPAGDAWAEWAGAAAKTERGYALMESADRIVELRDSPQPRIIAGPGGLFRLWLVGFTVTHAEVRAEALAPSDGDRLADDVRAALRQATREQDPASWFAAEGTHR